MPASLKRILHQTWAVYLRRRATLKVGELRARFRITSDTEFRFLFGYRFEREPLRRFLDALRPDDIVYDVGGHIGTWALFVAQRVPGGHVHVFEPHPGNREKLRANLALNGFGNVTVHAYALDERNGTTNLNVVGRAGDGRHSLMQGPQHRNAVPVETVCLRDVPRRLGIPAPHVVKIDVEGAEGRVVAGARPLMPSVRVVFLELHLGTIGARGRGEILHALAEDGLDVLVATDDRGGEEHVLLGRRSSRS